MLEISRVKNLTDRAVYNEMGVVLERSSWTNVQARKWEYLLGGNSFVNWDRIFPARLVTVLTNSFFNSSLRL